MDWKLYTEERKRRFCNLHLTKDVIFAEGGKYGIRKFKERKWRFKNKIHHKSKRKSSTMECSRVRCSILIG